MFATTLGIVLALASLDGKAPITGRLLDRFGGEPVAHFQVSVNLRGREPIELVTDADGYFATEDEFSKTRFSLGLIDHVRSPKPHGPSRARVSHDPERETPEEFRVAVGPRYALELVDEDGTPCANPESFDAFLYHDEPLALALPSGEEAPRAPVRDTGTVWARFRDRHCEKVLPGGPWWLEVRSHDGTRGGGARIESLHPRGEPVRIRLETRCVLSGRIVDQAQVPLDKAALRLKQSSDLTWHDAIFAEADGSFRFANLEPGDYELTVCDPRARGRRLMIPLKRDAAGGVSDITVDRFPSTEVLKGRIRSQSGEYEGGGELIFEPLDKELFAKPRITLEWRALDDETLVADFELEAPLGERYRVRLDTLDMFAWGAIGEARVGDSPVEFSLDDRTQLLEITILDEVSGEAIEAAETALNLGLYNDWLDGSYVELPGMPTAIEASALSWCVSAPGYVPVFGDLSDFTQSEERVQSLVLKLKRGWGTRFEIFDRRTLRPLTGVDVLLDGTSAGVTQAGWLDARLPEIPTTLDLRLDGWRWVGGSLDYRRIDILEEEAVPTLLWMTPN